MSVEENIAITKIGALIAALDEHGHDTASIKQFFDVGEWLIAFEGIENAQEEGIYFDDQQIRDIALLRYYFNE